MESKVTFKQVLIAALIDGLLQIGDDNLSVQVHSSIAFKNTVESILLLQESEICVVTESEITQVLINNTGDDTLTLKRVLIARLVHKVAEVKLSGFSKQVHSSIALKNLVESIVILKQSGICVINEAEIDEAIVKMQLNSLLEVDHG